MKDFLNHIVARHTNPVNPVMPRLRGIFEQEKTSPGLQESVVGVRENAPGMNSISPGGNSSGFTINEHPTVLPLNQQNFESEAPRKMPVAEKAESVSSSDARVNGHPVSDPFQHVKDLVPTTISIHNNKGQTHFEGPGKIQPIFTAQKENVSAPDLPGGLKHDQQSMAREWEVQVNKAKPSGESLAWARDIKNIISHDPPGTPTPAPVIRVNIGRIEVRASSQPSPVRTKADPRPAMSLDEFLKKKDGIKQ